MMRLKSLTISTKTRSAKNYSSILLCSQLRYPLPELFLTTFQVSYAYDRRLDFSQPGPAFSGLVLRGLPPGANAEQVMKNFGGIEGSKSFRAVRAEPPMNVKGQRCTVVHVENIEQAEMYSKRW